MGYRLCAFDLDGTVADTLADLTSALNFALQSLGYPERQPWEVSKLVGHGLVRTCKDALPEDRKDDWEKLHDAFNSYYGVHCCDATRPYAGLIPVLTQLKSRGVRLAVVTNKPHAFALRVISGLFPRDLFSCVIGKMEKFEIKPAPDSLNFVIDFLKTSKEDVLYVGDSDVDIQLAANAGVDCVSVSWGLRTRKELLAAGASHIIDEPAELLGFFPQ